ncbi:uncharacterized protein ColSpa_11924 [Colletotrichum spaethianum]|uniref:Rhodanese domain-containing protein n=1 Tax=Colletotrichum spaethianum TaxID=700344 RepID=A0AA37PG81_9PEZI|nr:uncharacterized protein ColSpa_11924 [Colletotrichum spaethianum]GKT51743.1 hypothetical protein ColSpa_11924 [Colletotrichum spaethianum]
MSLPSGCITDTGLYLKEHKPAVKIIDVCNRTGDPIPGPRPAPMFESIDFPWETVVDEVQEVDSPQSYRMSILLSREGLICGPSSGMALQALLNVLQKAKVEGRLAEFAGADGQVRAVFTCCDLPYQYMDNYARKLGPLAFEPIGNVHLLSIDTHPYDAAWELEATAAVEWLHKTAKFALSEKVVAVPGVKVVDIRAPADFAKEALFGAQNVPFDSVKDGIASPFDDVAVLEDQWTEMEELVGPEPAGHELAEGGGPILAVCYDGESSRVFTSILRAHGVEGYSIKGGFPSLKAVWRHGPGRI